MLPSVKIKANSSSGHLTFSSPTYDSNQRLCSCVVTFEIFECRGTNEIYTDTPHGGDSIEKYFSELAQNWRGWSGEKKYESLESDLEITAKSDSTRHTTLKVVLRSNSYFWKVRGYIEIDSTELERISKELQIFARSPNI